MFFIFFGIIFLHFLSLLICLDALEILKRFGDGLKGERCEGEGWDDRGKVCDQGDNVIAGHFVGIHGSLGFYVL